MTKNFFRSSALTLFLLGALAVVLTSASNAAPVTGIALTPRVYLPLQFRHYDAQPPTETRLGAGERPGFLVGASPQSLNLYATAGLKWARTSIFWSLVEPQNTSPENYAWDKVDYYLLPMIQSGIEPFVLILNTPAWAGTTHCGPLYNNADFAEFFGAVVARYPQVKYWGLFNEVDNAVYSLSHGSSGGCFGEPDLDQNGLADYADYAELMRVAWKAMHNANPNTQLVFAIVAFDNFTPATQPPHYPGGCCFNHNFLADLLGYMEDHPLPAGDKYADVLGFNNYLAYNLAYWDKHSMGIGVDAKANALRAIMAAHGFDFPMVITEMSAWPTYPSAEGVPQATQARQAAQMYAQALYSDIQFTTWWTWSDYPDTNCGVNVQCDLFKYGLVDSQLTPKQSYFAVQNLANQLRGWKPDDARIKAKYVDLGFKKNGKKKRVVYARTNTFIDAVQYVSFNAHMLRVVDMMGNISTFDDNGTGKISLRVNANPRYVEIDP